jgi:hypothetical protein
MTIGTGQIHFFEHSDMKKAVSQPIHIIDQQKVRFLSQYNK